MKIASLATPEGLAGHGLSTTVLISHLAIQTKLNLLKLIIQLL